MLKNILNKWSQVVVVRFETVLTCRSQCPAPPQPPPGTGSTPCPTSTARTRSRSCWRTSTSSSWRSLTPRSRRASTLIIEAMMAWTRWTPGHRGCSGAPSLRHGGIFFIELENNISDSSNITKITKILTKLDILFLNSYRFGEILSRKSNKNVGFGKCLSSNVPKLGVN